MIRLLIGFFIGPLILTGLMFFGWFSVGLLEAKVAACVSLVVAYSHVLIFGPPWYWILKKTHHLTLPYILFAGTITAVITSGIWGFTTIPFGFYTLWPASGFLFFLCACSGLCGLIVSYIIWWIAIRPSAACEAAGGW